MRFLETIYKENKFQSKQYYDKNLTGKVWDFFDKEIPNMGYETREGQEDMAYDICDAIKEKEHIMIEAGVGIGKSYAYIVPLIYYSKLTGTPVVISTSTILLQEQLIKDIEKVGEMLHMKIDVVLAKGMTHFKCIERAKKYSQNNNLKDDIRRWISNENIGDRAELKQEISEAIWDKINIKSCDYRKCSMYNKCYYIKQRNKMLKTKGIILCNHDLLAIDLKRKKNGERAILSKDVSIIVVDEAHNLEEKIRNSLKDIHSYTEIVTHIKNAESYLRKHQRSVEDNKVEEGIKILREVFFEFKRQIEYQKNRIEGNEGDIERYYIKRDKILHKIIYINRFLDDLNTKVQLTDSLRDEDIQDDIIENLDKAIRLFKGLTGDDTNYIFWGELMGSYEDIKNIKILQCPKKMAKEIKNLFFNNNGFETILTSATLTNSSEGEEELMYKYIVNTLGFPAKKGGTLSTPKKSPYDYDKNMIIYYKNDMPHPIKERRLFIEKGIDEIVNLVNLTKGKTMVLFTAKSDMLEVYEGINERVEWNVIKQEEGKSQESIINEFKEDESSIILGTGSYWEGVNIEGKTLSSLIIFRLPFPVPDPVMDYKKTLVNNPLLEVDLPEMIIKLKQGVGRLIRNASDRGIITILDPRINDSSTNQYKKQVWMSLPTDNRTNNIDDIKRFIERHNIDK